MVATKEFVPIQVYSFEPSMITTLLTSAFFRPTASALPTKVLRLKKITTPDSKKEVVTYGGVLDSNLLNMSWRCLSVFVR